MDPASLFIQDRKKFDKFKAEVMSGSYKGKEQSDDEEEEDSEEEEERRRKKKEKKEKKKA